MKNLFCLFIALCSGLLLQAQVYNTVGGIRLGTDWGITAKHRIDKKVTLEGIFQSSLSKEELLITGLIEKHSSLITKHLNFYTGIGLHKGWNSTVAEGAVIKDPFGVTAIAGAEFNLGRLNLSWDFKPAFNLVGGERTLYSQTGISLRYVFVKKPLFKKKNKRKKGKKKINWKFWENW